MSDTITMPRAVVQQALSDICAARLCEVNSMSSRQEMLRLMIRATDNLRAALAQQAEPVVWECKAGGLKPLSQRLHDLQPDNIKRHYTPIPRREWQGLTEDDFPAIRDGDTAFRSGALWADRLLKEKNK
jgi:hypothetical protein